MIYIDEYIFASILGIYVCYFLRLDTNKLRFRMNNLMTEDYQIIDFETFCKHIVRNLVDEIKIEPGIAKNRALLENLFALFICINNKIPLFLCGKPGYSKSLSLSIIERAMRGKKSTSEKFKLLPEISRSTYQGSLTSTSEGVLNVFNNTRTKLKNNSIRMEKDVNILKQKVIKLKKEFKKLQYENNISLIQEKEKEISQTIKEIEDLPKIKDYIFMIYFDEMGLAEISPNNPLKVIHSQLEYEKEEEKLAFVGISNWTLDASKMNRGIYLAVSEPDEKDCIETAIEIANSYEKYNNLGSRHEDIFKLLAKGYITYIHNPNNKEKIDFHGARDFYHLIKLTARNFIKKELGAIIDDYDIIRNSIQRNFGGYDGSVENFEKIINQLDPQYNISTNINITECINQNINDKFSRYLMVISDPSKSQFLIKFFLDSINKEKIFLLGSQFEKDLKSEEYTASLLQKIQGAMRNGDIIVMNNLEPIYPSLYDLFNQTFIEICKKKYARITIGSSTDSLFEVDEGFKSIILVDNKKLEQQDKPFLNRFEKQIFSFKDLLTEDENNFAKGIYDILKTAIEPFNKSIKSTININSHLINFNLEEIRGIIYDNKGKSNEEIKNIILEKISFTFSEDVMINMNYSSFHSKYIEEFNHIIEYYNIKPNNFDEFFERLNLNKRKDINNQIKNHKNIIFTFSQIFEGIEREEISLRIIDRTDYEKAILDFIEKFFRSEKKKVMVIQMKQEFCHHLNHILNLIDNYITDNDIDLNNEKESKYITFIIHLNRDISKNKNKENDNMIISHLSPYNQIFIDNLKGENIKITRFYNLDNKMLFNTLEKIEESQSIKFFNKDLEFQNIIYQGFMRFSYNFLNKAPKILILKDEIKIEELTTKNYQQSATISFINERKEFLTIIQEKIVEVICNKEMKNIILEILKESKSNQKGIDFISDIKEYMRDLLLNYFIKFIYKSENDGTLPSILFNSNKSERVKEYYENYIKNLVFEKEDPSMDIKGNTINVIFGLDIPLIYPNLFNMKIYASTLSKKFKNIEYTQRWKKILNEDTEQRNFTILEMQKQFVEKNIFENLKYGKEIDKEDMDIFYNNLITIFIFDNMKDTKNYNEILKFILESKFDNKELESYNNTGEVILWIETYKYFIIDILKIINELFPENFEEFKNKVLEMINLRKQNNKGDEKIIANMIKLDEPFYSIIEFFTSYVIHKNELFEEKIDFLEYSCDLFIQYIEELFIPNRLIFLLKNCIDIYKIFEENKTQFNKYINEINDEINNLRNNDIEKMKINWKNELEILIDHHNKIDFILSLYISKYRQITNIEYRKYLIQMIIENNILLPNSQRFFSRVFLNRSAEINKNIINENEKSFIIFYETIEDEEILNLLNDVVLYKNEETIKTEKENKKFVISNEKRKVLIQILLYVFQSKINISEDELNEYSGIINNICLSIYDNNLEKIKKNNLDFIIYPNLTRIYSSAFLQIFLNKLYYEILNGVKDIKNLIDLFLQAYQKLGNVWKYVQILMLKILYYHSGKDINKLNQTLKTEKNALIIDLNKFLENKKIEEILNTYDVDKEEENYYSIIFLPNLVNISEIKNKFILPEKKEEKKAEIDTSKQIINKYSINYPILSVFMRYYDDLIKEKSFHYQLKNILILNDFENSLLKYFNVTERLDRNQAHSIPLEQEIDNLNSKIYIQDIYNEFKNIWNDQFSKFEYEINGEILKIKKIDSKTVIEDILMDNKKNQKGRQITEIYKKLIKCQNDLIDEFIKSLNEHMKMLQSENNNFENKLKIKEINYLLNELSPEHSINIQNVTEREIINLEKINTETFKNFKSLVYGFSKRKCFNTNLTLNFNEYDEYEINYELLEKYLRKNLLYGKRRFNNNLKFINYKSEYSEENFSSNLNELISIFGYEKLSNEIKEKIEKYDNLPSILVSLDQLIFYLNHNTFNENSTVFEISNSVKKIANLTIDFNKLIEDNNFKIKELPGLYDYLEEKIFPETKESAKNQEYMEELYKGEISRIIKDKMDRILEDNEFIHKDTLLRALRKFTIKYLLSEDCSIISEKLFDCLQIDQGLWIYQKEDNNNAINQRDRDFTKIKNLFVNQSDILVKHTILFYEKLNNEDKYKKPEDKGNNINDKNDE